MTLRLLALALTLAACGSSHAPPPPPDETTDAGPTDTGPLAAPTSFAAPEVGSWGLTLSWDDVPNATGYRVYAAVSPAEPVLFASPGSNAVSFSPIEAGVTYDFRVTAMRGDVEGAAATLLVTLPPAAPGNLRAVGGSSSTVQLAWDAVAHAATYVLSDCTASCTVVTETADTHAEATGLTAGSLYTFRVRAKNGGGEGPASASVFVATAPQGPTIASFDGETTNSIQVHYGRVDGAATYVLEIALAEAGPYFPAGNTVDPFTKLTAAGLRPDSEYFFRITASNALGRASGAPRSYRTSVRNFGTGAAPPTPIGLALAPVAGGIDVSWTGSFDLYTTVNVLAATSEAGPFVPVAAGSGNARAFSWRPLASGVRSCVALEAVSVATGGPVFSGVSAPACATVPGP